MADLPVEAPQPKEGALPEIEAEKEKAIPVPTPKPPLEKAPEEIKKEEAAIPAPLPTPDVAELEPNLSAEVSTPEQVLSEASQKIEGIEKENAAEGKVAEEAKKTLDEERRRYLALIT